MEFIKSGDAYDLGGSAVVVLQPEDIAAFGRMWRYHGFHDGEPVVVNVDAGEVHDPERWHDYASPGAVRGLVALAGAFADHMREVLR